MCKTSVVGVIVYLMMMMLSDQCSTSSSAATELVWFVSISDLAPESVFNVYSSINDTIAIQREEKIDLSTCLLIFVKKLGSILQTNCLGKGLCWIKLSTEEGQRKIDSFVGNWRVLIYKSTTSPLSFMHQSCLNRLETFIIISKHSQNCAVL